MNVRPAAHHAVTEREQIAEANRQAVRITNKAAGSSIEECMEFWGISAGTIEELGGNGIIVKVARGRYDLPRSTRLYLKYLRDAAQGRFPNQAGQVSQADEAAKLKQAQRKMAELQLALANGTMVKAAEVDFEWQHRANKSRELILSLPVRIRVALDLTIKDEERIESVCDTALAEFSRTPVDEDE